MREGWKYQKLGELVKVINGLWVGKKPPFTNVAVVRNANFTKSCTLDMSNIAYIDVEEKQFNTRELQYADIIIEKSGGSEKQPVGRPVFFNIKDRGYSFSNFTATLRVVSSDIVPEYLYKVLLAQYKQGVTKRLQSKTTGLHNLDFKSYLKSVIPIPSCEKQLSIVSELDKINELIRLKKEQLKDYDNLAQSIFYEMFGDPVMNEKGWEVKKLGEVCTYPNKRISLSDITSYEYVGVETLVKNKGGVLFTEELPNAKNAIEYIENDILIGNIRPYLKKIWKSDRHGGASGDVVIIRISDSMKGLLTPVYLFKLLSTDEFFEYDNANTHGAKMPRGDRKAIGEFTIQIPPMHLQHIFAQRIELIERQKAEIQSTIADLETLLASRMQYWVD